MTILNFIFILIASLYFKLICEYHNFKIQTIIIAFSTFFLNYPILKLMGYYPLLTDYISFSIGIALYYYYIKRKSVSVLICTVIGAFSWPTVLIQGLLLNYMPNKEISLLNSPKKQIFRRLIIGVFNYSVILLPVIIYGIITVSHIFFNKFQISLHREVTNNDFLVLSMLLTGAMIFLFFYSVLRNSYQLLSVLIKQLNIKRIVLMILVFITINFVMNLISSNSSRHNIHSFIFELLAESIQAPLTNLVNHFAYYGFTIILIILFWKKYIQLIFEQGFGYLSILCMAFIFSIGNESRYLINFIPFLLFPIFIILNTYRIATSWSVIFMIASLILSRFWFTININDITNWDNYMLSQGPWQPFKFYINFLIIFIISSLALLKLKQHLQNQDDH